MADSEASCSSVNLLRDGSSCREASRSSVNLLRDGASCREASRSSVNLLCDRVSCHGNSELFLVTCVCIFVTMLVTFRMSLVMECS